MKMTASFNAFMTNTVNPCAIIDAMSNGKSASTSCVSSNAKITPVKEELDGPKLRKYVSLLSEWPTL